MDYSKLTTLFRRMLDNTVPTQQVVKENHPNSIDFWGSDSYAWMITEGYPTVEMRPDESLGPSFSLVGEGIAAHDEFLKELNTDQQIEKAVGIKSLEKLLEKLLRLYNEKKDSADVLITDSIKAEIKEIKESIKGWTAVAPVDFLIFEDVTELTVGKVTFKTGKEIVDYTKVEFHTRIDANASSEEDKAGLKALIDQQVPQIFISNSVVAKISVEGESSKVKDLAEEEIETSLNLLRCYTHVLFSHGLRVKMGLRHTTGYYFRPSMGFSSTDESWTFESNNVGVNHNFELSKAKIAFLKKRYAFDELSQIIAKPTSQRTKLEKLIVTTIRWLGRGVSEDDKANKVLHYAAASETLIMGQISEGEITEKFSRRLAYLIGRSSEERANLYARAKALYNKRSKVIHAGSTAIEESDVIALEFLTLKALVEMAKKTLEWRTHDDFTNWYQSISF
jgi:hypothetical protein